MSLLSYTELCALVDQGVIRGVREGAINGTSIDVHLGDEILYERYCDHGNGLVDIARRTPWDHGRHKMMEGQWYDLRPGEFVLAATAETFYLPNDISAEFRLKSSGARSGLENSFACHCDPGWTGSALTLELKNMLQHHTIRLTPGCPIGQMLFHRVTPVPADRSYAVVGRYNHDSSAMGVKR
jgi:dCTP deaminase